MSDESDPRFRELAQETYPGRLPVAPGSVGVEKKEEQRTLSVVDTDSSKTSTKDVVLSTADRPTTTGVEPTTADRPTTTDKAPVFQSSGSFTSWEVTKFARALGFEGRLPGPTFKTLSLRLEVESGRRTPYTVAAGHLPANVHPIVKRSFDGFVYLLACKWLHTPNEPAPWTHDFAAKWCGITERQAKDARSYLVRIGALVQVGEVGRAKLWLPWGVTTPEGPA